MISVAITARPRETTKPRATVAVMMDAATLSLKTPHPNEAT